MRSLRPFMAPDAPLLAAFLRAEGLPDDQMAFAQWPTFVLEEGGQVMGFVTLAMAGVWPTVVHLVIARAHRSLPRVRFLGRALRALVREAGYPRMIVHACSPEVRRVVAYYFRAEPYAEQDGRAYYLVTA